MPGLTTTLKSLVPSSIKTRVKPYWNAVLQAKAARARQWPRATINELPWFDRPDALEKLSERRYSKDDRALLEDWINNGYAIVKAKVLEKSIDSMLAEADSIWSASYPEKDLAIEGLPDIASLTHEKLLRLDAGDRERLRRSFGWRIHGFYRFSSAAREIFESAELKRITSMLFDMDSEPVASINFTNGSEQAIHQDMAVFHIYPRNFLIGAWIACEDISVEAGPLVYYPGSHREAAFDGFSNYPQTNLRTADPSVTRRYQSYIDGLTSKYERHHFLAKKGDVLFWHGLILHGGEAVRDRSLTRKSYVIHYVPPGMNRHGEVAGPFNW